MDDESFDGQHGWSDTTAAIALLLLGSHSLLPRSPGFCSSNGRPPQRATRNYPWKSCWRLAATTAGVGILLWWAFAIVTQELRCTAGATWPTSGRGGRAPALSSIHTAGSGCSPFGPAAGRGRRQCGQNCPGARVDTNAGTFISGSLQSSHRGRHSGAQPRKSGARNRLQRDGGGTTRGPGRRVARMGALRPKAHRHCATRLASRLTGGGARHARRTGKEEHGRSGAGAPKRAARRMGNRARRGHTVGHVAATWGPKPQMWT